MPTISIGAETDDKKTKPKAKGFDRLSELGDEQIKELLDRRNKDVVFDAVRARNQRRRDLIAGGSLFNPVVGDEDGGGTTNTGTGAATNDQGGGESPDSLGFGTSESTDVGGGSLTGLLDALEDMAESPVGKIASGLATSNPIGVIKGIKDLISPDEEGPVGYDPSVPDPTGPEPDDTEAFYAGLDQSIGDFSGLDQTPGDNPGIEDAGAGFSDTDTSSFDGGGPSHGEGDSPSDSVDAMDSASFGAMEGDYSGYGDEGGDSGGNGNGDGCFLATAVGGFDSPTIVKLQAFTKNFLEKTPKGRRMVRDYYRRAPLLVKRIPKGHVDWKYVAQMVDGAIAFIEAGRPQEALALYEIICRCLVRKYGIAKTRDNQALTNRLED